MDECKKCKLKKLCRECPTDFSCDDVKRLAGIEAEREGEDAPD